MIGPFIAIGALFNSAWIETLVGFGIVGCLLVNAYRVIHYGTGPFP